MFIRSEPCGSTIDFKKLRQVVNNQDNLSLQKIMDGYNSEIVTDGYWYRELDGSRSDYELFMRNALAIFRAVEFANRDDITPSINSMFEEGKTLEGESSSSRSFPFVAIQQHVRRAGAERIRKYYNGKSCRVPLILTNLLIDKNFEQAIHGSKPFSVTKSEMALALETESNLLLVLLIITLIEFDDYEQIISEYQKVLDKDSSIHLGIETLLNPLDGPCSGQVKLATVL